MKTATGFEVDRPRDLLAGFICHWYPMYDGVDVPQDGSLRVMEIALSTMLNSRISGNTAGAIWRDAKRAVEDALSAIPPFVDLLDVPVSSPIPGEHAIGQAIEALCGVRRSKLAVATKILHKKRPGLIPIFDSVVERHYWPHLASRSRRTSWADYAIELVRLVHRDMLSVADELHFFRQELAKGGTPMTGCRILNVLIWAVNSGNETWLRDIADRDAEHSDPTSCRD